MTEYKNLEVKPKKGLLHLNTEQMLSYDKEGIECQINMLPSELAKYTCVLSIRKYKRKKYEYAVKVIQMGVEIVEKSKKIEVTPKQQNYLRAVLLNLQKDLYCAEYMESEELDYMRMFRVIQKALEIHVKGKGVLSEIGSIYYEVQGGVDVVDYGLGAQSITVRNLLDYVLCVVSNTEVYLAKEDDPEKNVAIIIQDILENFNFAEEKLQDIEGLEIYGDTILVEGSKARLRLAGEAVLQLLLSQENKKVTVSVAKKGDQQGLHLLNPTKQQVLASLSKLKLKMQTEEVLLHVSLNKKGYLVKTDLNLEGLNVKVQVKVPEEICDKKDKKGYLCVLGLKKLGYCTYTEYIMNILSTQPIFQELVSEMKGTKEEKEQLLSVLEGYFEVLVRVTKIIVRVERGSEAPKDALAKSVKRWKAQIKDLQKVKRRRKKLERGWSCVYLAPTEEPEVYEVATKDLTENAVLLPVPKLLRKSTQENREITPAGYFLQAIYGRYTNTLSSEPSNLFSGCCMYSMGTEHIYDDLRVVIVRATLNLTSFVMSASAREGEIFDFDYYTLRNDLSILEAVFKRGVQSYKYKVEERK